MARLTLPPAPLFKAITYSDLKGVDFSRDQALVSRERSPDLLNMISDNGGLPIKRFGWQTLATDGKSRVDNIWVFVINGRKRCVVSIGTKLKEFNLNTNSFLGEGFPTKLGDKAAFFMQTVKHKGLYVLNDKELIEVTSTSEVAPLTFKKAIPKIPTVLIARDPVKGGGVVFESVNVLTRERAEQFLNKDNSKTFLVSSTVDTTKSWKFEYKTSSGEWKTATATVNGATFTVSEAYPPIVVGEDNVKITYYATGALQANKISSCKSATHYSQSALDQIFLTGNADFPQYVYYSAPGDPTYFPDLNYLLIGSGGTQIMGFMTVGQYLAVVKENSGDASTVFLVSPTTISDVSVTTTTNTGSTTKNETRTEYKVQASSAGIGAISRKCFKLLNDEPLMFSRNGVFGMVSTVITSEKILRNRSKFLDKKLLEEPNLENAIAEIWNGYYILCVNGRAYVLDGRNRARDGQSSYFYESYYWDNIPATCLCAFDDELYFGTNDGRICKFKKGTDMTVYSDDDKPIKAVWSTPLDNDGAAQFFKTMQKKGSMCTFAPFAKSSVNVYIETDGKERMFIGTASIDAGVDFRTIDFSKFTFDATTTPRDIFFRKKLKKYKRMKITLENNSINEGFGVHSIVKTIIYTRHAK